MYLFLDYPYPENAILSVLWMRNGSFLTSRRASDAGIVCSGKRLVLTPPHPRQAAVLSPVLPA